MLIVRLGLFDLSQRNCVNLVIIILRIILHSCNLISRNFVI